MPDAVSVDPASVSNDELVIHTCGPADREEQARLFNACFKKTLDAEALRWRYDLSPHGQSVSVVARPPGGEGISGYACSPRQAVVFGEPSSVGTIGQTGDVMTHPDWRKRGIFSSLDRACMEETARRGWQVIFGLPNRRSAHIFLKLGWDRVGTIRPWTHYFGAGGAARAIRGREGRLLAARLPLEALRCRWRRDALARAGARFELRPLARFPDEVEELSHAVEVRFELMVRRTADYLNWRFVDTTARLHQSFGVYEGGRLAGYVVVQLPREGERVGYVVDALAPGEDALRAALGGGLRVLADGGAVAVQATAIDGSFWARALSDAGFLPPKRENHLIVIRFVHDRDHPLARATADASRWYLTDGDRDDETMG